MNLHLHIHFLYKMTAESEACLVGFISVSKLFTCKLITEEITQKTFNYHLHCTVNVRTEVIYFVISVYSSRNVSSEPIQDSLVIGKQGQLIT